MMRVNRQWTYDDKDRSGGCCDCGLPYEDFLVELVIDHDIWEEINPSYHKGAGILCHQCMIERLQIKKIEIVGVLFFGINPLDD